MADKLTWDSPEVRDLRQRSDRDGIAALVREGRLTLDRRNPYRRMIPVEDPAPSDRREPVGEEREPLTQAEFDRLRREGRVAELREAAAAGRIPWNPKNPYRPATVPTPASTEGE